MKPAAPYYLQGAAGHALALQQIDLAGLHIFNAVLTLRSLEVDTLTFSIIRYAGGLIPDDGQWFSLYDSTGTRLFTGIGKRTYQHPQGIYTYEVSNVYLGMRQTNLLSSIGRPFVTYDQGDLRARLRSILLAATSAGLPVQAPSYYAMPQFYAVPKCSFRTATIATALEDTCKWAADIATRMDYSVEPPMLRFYTRTAETAFPIDLDSGNNHATTCQLTAFPEARALSVAFVYAERSGSQIVTYRVQQAGNDSAEARRKTSIYLSGSERTDLMVSEAVSTSNSAVATANAALAAANAAITAVNAQISADYAAALAAIPATVDQMDFEAYVRSHDSFFTTTGAGVSWYGQIYPITLYTSVTTGSGFGTNYTQTVSPTGCYISQAGWAVNGNPFTSAQLATAGATSVQGYYGGEFYANVGNGSDLGQQTLISGWPAGYYLDLTYAAAARQHWIKHPVNVSVTILNKAPSVIRAALQAAAAAAQSASLAAAVGNTALIDRAEFVTAPADLATNYFARQDWTPYKGSLVLDPQAPDFPAPGSFVNVAATTTPTEWAAMKAPVSELQLDLATGAATVTLGPPARMDFQSLIDRLRIPIEDNYQAG